MACYYPWSKSGGGAVRPFSCGRCHGCLLERSRQWGVRIMNEAQLYDSNCFITLTFRDNAIMSLDYVYFQLFMKRLRARFNRARIRFFMCGEYGKLSRPHFHACLFGINFPDLVFWKSTDSDSKIYRSAILEELWPLGFSSVGAVNFESATYVARYCMKKAGMGQTNDIIDPASGEVFHRTPEFCRMSNGGRGKDKLGGIGKPWLDKFFSDVYPHGTIHVNGRECKPPRYYDKILRSRDAGLYMELSFRRAETADKYFSETLPSRLEARSDVAKARLKLFKREIL